MPRYRASDERRAPLIWQQFQETVDPLLLTAPKINWDQVERRFMNYITVKTAGRPWCNHLALFLGVAAISSGLFPRFQQVYEHKLLTTRMREISRLSGAKQIQMQ